MKLSKIHIGVAVVAVILIVLVGAGVTGMFFAKPGQYDEFAQCLTDSGVKIYGTYWCSHCLNQKNMFGNSWKYVNYIECSLPNRAGQTPICQQAGIESYPTWEFADGQRVSGELSFSALSEMSGCEFQ